jgi:hypothetical protein
MKASYLPRPPRGLGRLAGVALLGCWAVLAVGCSEADQRPASALQKPGAVWEQALELGTRLEARRERALALCALAAKAAPGAPDLAREYYEEAWEQARGLAEAKGAVLANRLREDSGASQPQRRRQELALAARLEDLCRRAWPLRVVAEGAQALAPQVAAQALQQGLALARQNSDPAARDQDLGGLALVLARRDPGAARALAADLGDPLWRAWIQRELATLEGGPQAWTQAAQAAREIPQTAIKALELAATALAGFESDPALGLTLFQEAFQSAGNLPQARQRALLQGQVAALLVRVDAESGWRLAQRTEPLEGARFLACRRAGQSLLGLDPVAGRRALHEAWDAAQTMSLEYERQRAICLLVQDLAGPDPDLARELLAALGPGENLLRGEAEAAMVLAEAARDLDAALRQARQMVDPLSRMQVLARLAALDGAPGEHQSRGLRALALALAQNLGAAEALKRLALEWIAFDPRKGVDIAASIGENVARAEALSSVARALALQGQQAASDWALFLAQQTLDGLGSDQAIDKARLLGDMGQEWAAVNRELSRRFFQLGAEAARNMGQSS